MSFITDKILYVEAYCGTNSVLPKIASKLPFWEKMGTKCEISFSNLQKGTSLGETTTLAESWKNAENTSSQGAVWLCWLEKPIYAHFMWDGILTLHNRSIVVD